MSGPPTARPASSPPRPASRTRRFGLYAAVGIALVLVVLGLDALGLATHSPAAFQSGPYYLSLGDSIAYGFQPDLNFSEGYSDDIIADLRPTGVKQMVNYACGGETTTTMINGGCTGRVLKHDVYYGAQLDAAVTFLNQHKGQVNPVTLDIGANDLISDWNEATCSPTGNYQQDLATFDTNLTSTILPRLTKALAGSNGMPGGTLIMLDYYNPYAKVCPQSGQFIGQLNVHIENDARQFRVPVADVYAAFGGDLHQADYICTYTWICNAQYHDVHPTTKGYQVIASAVERSLGFPGTGPVNPFSNGSPLGSVHSAPVAEVASWRPSRAG